MLSARRAENGRRPADGACSRSKRGSSASAGTSSRAKRGSSSVTVSGAGGAGSLKYSVARYEPAAPAASAASAQPAPFMRGNSAASTDGFPGPLSASATMAAMSTALYS
jgi:hypothetical protein